METFKEINKGGGGLWNPTTTHTPYPLLSHVLGEYRTMVDQDDGAPQEHNPTNEPT
jgi:hypothetical protein